MLITLFKSVAEKEEVDMNKYTARIKNQRGQGLVEYALLVLLIVGVVIAAVTPLRTAITGAFTRTSEAINNAS